MHFRNLFEYTASNIMCEMKRIDKYLYHTELAELKVLYLYSWLIYFSFYISEKNYRIMQKFRPAGQTNIQQKHDIVNIFS